MRLVSCVLIIVAILAAPATASAQTAIGDGQLLASVDHAIAVVQPLLDKCPDDMEYVPMFTPGKGVAYECRPPRPAVIRDRLGDRLTELNAGLIIIDSTLTGYLVWNGIGLEANPLMKPIFDADRPWRVGVKGALGAAQMIGIYRVSQPRSKRRYTMLTAAILINAYACVNNYRIYRDHRDTLK